MNMITIKDIAKLANVSEGTVDRVLHKRGGVSNKTEEKINQILKKNNFRLNPIASVLASKKKFKLSCLIPKYDTQNLFWKSPQMGIKMAKEELINYGLQTTIHTFNQFDSETYLNQFDKLLKTKPDAIILVPTFYKETKQILIQLDDQNIPYLFLNIDIEGTNKVSFVGQDSYQSGYAVGKLMSLFLREKQDCVTIRTRTNVSNYSSISKRIEGFENYLTSHDSLIMNYNLNFNSLVDLKFIKQRINTFLVENKHIKGIYVPSSRASVIANSITKENLKGLCIIGFDTTDNNVNCLKEDKIQFLISQKSFKQGYNAVRVMSDLLIYKKMPKSKIFSPIQIIIKENIIYTNTDETILKLTSKFDDSIS